MHGNRIIGGTIAALTVGCLFLTAWIMQRSGALQGATEDGRWALGLAAIAVHLGLAVFGLAMFASRKWSVFLVCGLMVLGAAACSAWQIATFLATEVISVTKAREATTKREDARAAAAIALAKERQKTQAKLAEGHLKWVEGTVKNAGGRRERKDSFEAGTKVIAEMGKGEAPPLPEPKAEAPPIQSGVVAQWIAAYMGWDETAMQASPYLMIALMLLTIEVVGWPMSSFFWNRPAPVAHAMPAFAPPPPMPAPVSSRSPVALPPPHVEAEVILPEKAERVHPSKRPPPDRSERRPVAGSVQSLIEIGFPVTNTKPSGPMKAKEPPKDAARRFVVWAKAMDLAGSYSPGELYDLYREFAEADHREPVGYNQLAKALEKTKGINKRRPRLTDGSFPTVWEVTPGRFPKLLPKPAKPEQHADSEPVPVEEGRPRVPFSASPGDLAPTTKQARPMPKINYRGLDPAIIRARARMLRREGRMVRRQRGPRISRRAAA